MTRVRNILEVPRSDFEDRDCLLTSMSYQYFHCMMLLSYIHANPDYPARKYGEIILPSSHLPSDRCQTKTALSRWEGEIVCSIIFPASCHWILVGVTEIWRLPFASFNRLRIQITMTHSGILQQNRWWLHSVPKMRCKELLKSTKRTENKRAEFP